MKSYIKALALVVAAGTASQASAQLTYSGYFLDNYTYRYQMNPAFANESNFVAMPVLGDLNLAMHGNLNLSDLLYSVDGKTVLFTNPAVSASEVLGNISDKNRLGAGVKLDIMSAGWKAWGGFNTVTLSLNANANVSVPGTFFRLAKEGIENKTYDIKNMYGNANAYMTLALNHSRDILQVPGLRAGAAMKFYIGGGNVDFKFNRAELELAENNWKAIVDADIYASVTGFRYDHEYNDRTGREYVSGGNLDDGFGLNGFGIGFDLGAEYKWQDFRFSVAVLDLGFISWGKTQWASTNGEQTVSTDAYTFNVNSDASNSFDNELDRLGDDLTNLYQLSDNGELGSRTRAMGATLNFGVDYEFPYYRPLHFGILNSTVINGAYTWNQTRISADVAPVKWVSAGINMEAGTFGVGFGWLLNFNTKGFNCFVGMDHTIGKLSKQMIPLKSNACFNFGINFPF